MIRLLTPAIWSGHDCLLRVLKNDDERCEWDMLALYRAPMSLDWLNGCLGPFDH